MKQTSEIYLTKKYVKKEEWMELIKTISNYNGFLRTWKIIITHENNQIRYFINTRCTLPSTINNLNSFLLKSTKNINKPIQKYSLLSLPQIGCSIIDLINYIEIKNKGKLHYLEIKFIKLYEEKIKSKIEFYVEKNSIIKKYKVIFALPTNILAVDFEGNKRYFYKSSPKYLDINKTFNFKNLRKLLLDVEYRNSLIKQLKYNLPISVIDFFLSDFNDLKTKYYGEAISPIIGFIDEMEMIPVFNSEQNIANLKNTIKENFFTLFSLDRIKLGEKVTKTISGLIMQQLL